jgi:glycosyltransferase involved in cell wall biosynthesis
MIEEASSNSAVEDAGVWPRISIVTPVRNSGKYLEQTMRSVLGQNYPNLEYFIVDGGSTDRTLDIICKYENQLTGWISEPDKGMYDALSKGFARTTGEIMGWLNASDLLHVNGLFVVGGVFGALRQVEWITGHPTKFNLDGATIELMDLPRWSRFRFLAGANKWIQQESTFWRRSLWEKAGARVDASLRSEGDFELWVRFFRHAKLYTVDALIGGYRLHEDALGWTEMERHERACEEIVEREIASLPGPRTVKLFRRISRAVRGIPKIRGLWYRLAIKNLYRMTAPDLAPVIRYDVERGWYPGK